MPQADATDRLLVAYLDGTLAGEALASLQSRLAHDAALRERLQSMQRVEQSLRRSFAGAPAMTAAQILALADQSAAPLAHIGRGSLVAPAVKSSTARLRRLAVAAALAGGLFGAWMVWQQFQPEPQREWAVIPAPTTITAAGYYADKVAKGFEPDWVCSNDDEFATTFRDRFGKGLALKDSTDPATRMLGLDYAMVLSPHTVSMLAESGGQKIIVFIDARERDNAPAISAGCGTLNVHRREIGPMVVYELSPLDQPKMLDLLEVVE